MLYEVITVFYGAEPAEMRTFWAKITGPFALPFWTMVAGCFFIPLALMARQKTRTPQGTLIAGIAVMVGMWLERFNIVVPTSVNPIWEIETLGHRITSYNVCYTKLLRLLVLHSPHASPPPGYQQSRVGRDHCKATSY